MFMGGRSFSEVINHNPWLWSSMAAVFINWCSPAVEADLEILTVSSRYWHCAVLFESGDSQLTLLFQKRFFHIHTVFKNIWDRVITNCIQWCSQVTNDAWAPQEFLKTFLGKVACSPSKFLHLESLNVVLMLFLGHLKCHQPIRSSFDSRHW